MDRSRLLVVAAFGCLAACTPKSHPVVRADPTPAMRMAAADTLFRSGCLECLEQSLDQYQALRTDPAFGSSATEAAVRAALLIPVRENELGLLDSGRVRQARDLTQSSSSSESLAIFLDVADALASKPGGTPRSPYTDSESRAVTRIARTQLQWATALRQIMPDDLTAAYLWIGLACGSSGFDIPDRADRSAVLAGVRETSLVNFKNLTSCSIQREPVRRLLEDDPRFVEANYFLGTSALSAALRPGVRSQDEELEEASARFQTAYEWRPRWPVLTNSIANLALTAEDFERAIDFYGRTLALVADQPEALLGRVRAYTYAGRSIEAIAATDRLLAANHTPGEARYWRALNEEQLERHDDAWIDIEKAADAMVSPDVPKLAGLIAINRHQLDVARQRLELAYSSRPSDCETGFYLQAVLTEQRQWTDAAGVATSAAGCFDSDLARLSNEIDGLRASDMRADRRDRQIARREQQVRADTRMRAGSWFDAAAAHFNLAQRDEAKRFAEKLLDDDQYGVRARDLMARLSAQ